MGKSVWKASRDGQYGKSGCAEKEASMNLESAIYLGVAGLVMAVAGSVAVGFLVVASALFSIFRAGAPVSS